ncbi:hypothetical protein CSA56_07835 [candidate division KSB3 bacterium]|uniref:Trimethylamine methyltransferase n=1 Tax=candidate division KSB3 bacterium TaxID=2044937 RepID=A0A2G6KF43_9BACT|nr:MAG: hypothetical protein CSA56_07835 [candidate division KSB3 bacterium]
MGNMFKRTQAACDLPLDDAYCEQVVKGAVKLLHEHGLQLTSHKVRTWFSSGKGVILKPERICFEPDAIYLYLEDMRSRIDSPPQEIAFEHGHPWSCLNWADIEQGVVRPATEADLVRAVKFLDAYGVPGHVPPIALNAYPPSLRDLHGTRICLEHSPVYGAPTHTPGEKELDLYKQMSRVVNRQIWVLAMLIVNPMKFDDAVLEFVIDHHQDKELAIEMTGGLPCVGSTCPLVFPAAHMQGLAEDLAACMFMHAITGEYPPPYLRGGPFDMRFMNYCVAGSEYALLDLANRRLHEYLCGVPRNWGYLLSMSRWPDQQAAHERTVSCWLQAMNGATFFHGSGQLASDEVFSLEQVVIDRTIVKGAERMVKGLKWDTSFERSYQIIEEGLTQGNYLNHDSTLDEYRDFYGQRELFPAMNLAQWRVHHKPTPISMVQEIIDTYLAKHTFQREDHEIRELRRICQYGEKSL